MDKDSVSPTGLGRAESAIKELEDLGPGAIVTEEYLARVFNRCSTSVKRAVERGELPPPVRMFGQPRWTVGVILSHLEARLCKAKFEEEESARMISKHSP